MMVYIVVLGLGLSFLYTLRDWLLVLQQRHDQKLLLETDNPKTIISQNVEHCKQIRKAG